MRILKKHAHIILNTYLLNSYKSSKHPITQHFYIIKEYINYSSLTIECTNVVFHGLIKWFTLSLHVQFSSPLVYYLIALLPIAVIVCGKSLYICGIIKCSRFNGLCLRAQVSLDTSFIVGGKLKLVSTRWVLRDFFRVILTTEINFECSLWNY